MCSSKLFRINVVVTNILSLASSAAISTKRLDSVKVRPVSVAHSMEKKPWAILCRTSRRMPSSSSSFMSGVKEGNRVFSTPFICSLAHFFISVFFLCICTPFERSILELSSTCKNQRCAKNHDIQYRQGIKSFFDIFRIKRYGYEIMRFSLRRLRIGGLRLGIEG